MKIHNGPSVYIIQTTQELMMCLYPGFEQQLKKNMGKSEEGWYQNKNVGKFEMEAFMAVLKDKKNCPLLLLLLILNVFSYFLA